MAVLVGRVGEVVGEGDLIELMVDLYRRREVAKLASEAAGEVQWVDHHLLIVEAEAEEVEQEDTEIANTMTGTFIGRGVGRPVVRRRGKAVVEVVEGGEGVRLILVGVGVTRARHLGGIESPVRRAEGEVQRVGEVAGDEVRVIRLIVGGVGVRVGREGVGGGNDPNPRMIASDCRERKMVRQLDQRHKGPTRSPKHQYLSG